MPNNYFQFKQFTIQQEKSSMKVCTDSCLFGAWLADKIEKNIVPPENILDIGSGTGLLSLMLAQKSNATIDAIDINEEAYWQTNENFNESKWNQRLHAVHADIKSWTTPLKYDLIISNPPFFENDLRSGNRNKNVAKHHDTLTLEELIISIAKHLKQEGYFAVLLPFHRLEFFKKIAAQHNFYCVDEMWIKQTPQHSFFRGMLVLTRHKENFSSTQLTIKNKEGNYTESFIELLKDYYL